MILSFITQIKHLFYIIIYKMNNNMKIPYDRNEDIKIRGKDILVYDHNGIIVILSQAKMWYNHGKYVQPIKVEDNNYVCTDCIIS